MNKIGELLTQLNYKYTTESKSFMNNNIEIYTTYKYLNNRDENKKNVAKYLVVNCLDINFDLLTNNFEYFQKNLIADVFFSHRDDIRWNIYVFLIVECKSMISKEGYEIEKDEDYARKFIFQLEDLKDFLEYGFFGQVNSVNQASVKTNFMLEWDNYLNEHSLNGCIYNKMNTSSVEDYVSSEKPIRPIGRPTKNLTTSVSEDMFVIKQIDNFQFTNYRAHCFDREFTYSPSLVNLISGSNGSGKSSICDAIALGMSGISKSDEVIKVICKNSSGDKVALTSKKTLKDSRELDLTWYGTTTTGSKSRLVENFNIFNYMQPSAIYSNSSTDLNEILQNLMYGEETTQAWKNIQNYKEKFSTLRRSWKNQTQVHKNEVSELDKKISLFNAKDQSFEISYDDKFNLLSYISSDDKIKEKLNILDSVDYNVSKLDKEAVTLEGVITFGDIRDVTNSFMLEMNSVQLEKEKFDNLEKELNNLKIKITTNLNKRDKLCSLKAEYEEITRAYNSIEYKAIDSIGNRDEFISIYQEKKLKCNKLKHILKEYEDLKYYDAEVDANIDAIYEEISLSYQGMLKEYENVKKCLSEKQNSSGLSKSILANITRFANEYQTLHRDNSKCPLCGSDFINPVGIEEAIKNASVLNNSIDKELEIFIQKEQELSPKIRKTKLELENFEMKMKKNSKFIELIKRLEEIKIKIDASSIKEIYELSEEIVASLEEFLSKNKGILDFTSEMNIKDIYLEFSKQSLIEYFSIYLKHQLERIAIEMNENLEENKTLELDLAMLEKNLMVKDMVNEHYKEIRAKVTLCEEMISSIERVKTVFETIENTFSIKDWTRSFYNLKRSLEEKFKREEDDIYKKALFSDLEKKKGELLVAEEKLERCEKAIKALEGLDSLDENMSIFIMENAKKIERVFKMIHRPEEFTDLVIENGTIKFVRKTTKETININNVSTGQALSLVFAVTLCLHFSAKNVPNILMFDEPVANLDDVHIMNLVDMLKELSLMGVQLFITTANDQVATYIRRKFSCLTDDFKHLEIQRTDELPSIFTEKVYSPYKEAAKTRRLVAV